MRHIRIATTTGDVEFVGKHLPEREKPNWHYYATDDGRLLHFRKEHMVYVESQEHPDEINGQGHV